MNETPQKRYENQISNEEFDEMNWHDNVVHGFQLVEGADGYSGELILDIDHIVEWIKSADSTFSFVLTPSNLVFHNVTELIISINYAAAAAALQPISIGEIYREIFFYPNGYSSYRWKIVISWPSNSYITFLASGFSQISRKPSVISDSQCLSVGQR
jgi:hypothetical protein